MNPATDPCPPKQLSEDNRWMSMHELFIHQGKEKEPDVLILGDSLAQLMILTPLWAKLFEPLHCLNFGIKGDQTQNLLWRLKNGELGEMQPKVVVVLIGTNNVNDGHTAEQTTEGIQAVVDCIRDKQPQAQVIVMGIPPRGEKHNKLRETIADVNRLVNERIGAASHCMFFATDSALFVSPEGFISPNDMYDFLHLTHEGYRKILEPLADEIQNLLKTFAYSTSTEGM